MCWRSGLALITATWVCGTAWADPLTFVRAVPLTSGLPGFGGISAIETRDGSTAVLLSDRGAAFSVSLNRAAGTYEVARLSQPQPDRDSEGLAYSGGDLFYSYEGPGEVVDQQGKALPDNPAFHIYHPNGSFEALAAEANGTVYTLPERSGHKARGFPVYRFRNGAWDVPATLSRRNPFLPVGADIGPDGRLYILERAFSPLGFRSRIRTLDPMDWTAPPRTLLTTHAGQHDNLEGVTVWQSISGATCLSMVSDDNFLSILRTELVEYALTETLAGGATCD
ncbi:esterase-like activity of phytase family protein [uncultured Tateyamaria sp.]|uniref:esterase-like activity of phytase family protein n=1 Tax=uncultured Tateyamaria sp. TaxID=455651 RepID=UPI00260AE37F|nr:esterase-like activity of phytase family protein [uncultured Tateyamaria sp.]